MEQLEREELIKARLDFWHTKQCCLGARRLGDKLRKEDGLLVGRKLIKRCMDEMGIYAVYPKPNLSKHSKYCKPFPYLLKNKTIFLPNQVWAVDITYIKMGNKHMYMTAIIDWYSRFLVGWALSDTLETAPVLGANGHIAMRTPNLTTAVEELKEKGFTFNMDTAAYTEEGDLKNVYLDGEFGGFAIHIVQKYALKKGQQLISCWPFFNAHNC